MSNEIIKNTNQNKNIEEEKEYDNIKQNEDELVIIPSEHFTNQQKIKLWKSTDLMKSINKINQVSLKTNELLVDDEIINSSGSEQEYKGKNNSELIDNLINSFDVDEISEWNNVKKQECIYKGTSGINTEKIIDNALKEKGKGAFSKMLNYLIRNSTSEKKTRLKTIDNHFKSLLERTAKDIVHAKDKIGYAILTAIGRIKNAVIENINIYTLEYVNLNKIASNERIITKKLNKRMRKHSEFESAENLIENKPTNPSINLDTPIHEVENRNKIINADLKHNKINMSENKIEQSNIDSLENTKKKLRNMFNHSASKFNKLSKQLRNPNRYIDILIDNAAYLIEPISLVCIQIEKLVKLVDAQKNELIEKTRLKPYAQYQLLVRFLRACAFKQAKLPRDAKEEELILKNNEVEFETYRKKYPNKNYPSTYAKNHFKNAIISFLAGGELNIEALFHVYGM